MGKEVDWQILYQIHRYPTILKGLSSANYLFSPSFERYIDIDFTKAEFVIKSAEKETTIGRIPAGMISIAFKGRNRSEAAIPAMASRIRFHSEKDIEIITKDGLNCILDFNTLKVQSVASVDNFDREDFSHPHSLLEQTPLAPSDTVCRLMRTCNKIKQLRAHTKASLVSQHSPQLTEDEINAKLVKITYEQMFSVDYSQRECFAVELSFTILDWIILERVIKDKTFNVTHVGQEQMI